jgi:hypothetical protein
VRRRRQLLGYRPLNPHAIRLHQGKGFRETTFIWNSESCFLTSFQFTTVLTLNHSTRLFTHSSTQTRENFQKFLVMNNFPLYTTRIKTGMSILQEPGSSVSIVSGYGLDDRPIQIRSLAQTRYFSSSLCVQTGSGAHLASCTMGTGGPFHGGKARPKRDADHSPHVMPRSWMSRSYTSFLHQAPSWRVAGLLCFFIHLSEQTLPRGCPSQQGTY